MSDTELYHERSAKTFSKIDRRHRTHHWAQQSTNTYFSPRNRSRKLLSPSSIKCFDACIAVAVLTVVLEGQTMTKAVPTLIEFINKKQRMAAAKCGDAVETLPMLIISLLWYRVDALFISCVQYDSFRLWQQKWSRQLIYSSFITEKEHPSLNTSMFLFFLSWTTFSRKWHPSRLTANNINWFIVRHHKQ